MATSQVQFPRTPIWIVSESPTIRELVHQVYPTLLQAIYRQLLWERLSPILTRK